MVLRGSGVSSPMFCRYLTVLQDLCSTGKNLHEGKCKFTKSSKQTKNMKNIEIISGIDIAQERENILPNKLYNFVTHIDRLSMVV